MMRTICSIYRKTEGISPLFQGAWIHEHADFKHKDHDGIVVL
jgi:hypothetical protein